MDFEVQDFTELRWGEALVAQRNRLRKPRYEGLLRLLDYNSCIASMEEESQRYRKRRIARHMLSLAPTLKQLDSFVGALTTLSNANPEIAGTLWGLIQIVSVTASKFIGVMERITTMMKQLTHDLACLQGYIGLFPGEEILQGCFKCVITHYVGFCISALKFFRKCPGYKITTEANRNYPTKQLYEVPNTQNPRFCGRDAVLRSLHEFLTRHPESDRHTTKARALQKSCVIHGMGGVGKTQVAIEYTYLYRSSYDFIFWLSAENETVLQASAGRVLSSLVARWLLVFDNVEDGDTIAPCMPRTSHGAVLITSQHDRLSAAYDIQLEPLHPDEGSKFLLKHLKTDASDRDNLEDARKISAQLGGLPLALGYVAGYISNTKWSLREFLRNSELNPQMLGRIFAMPLQAATDQYKNTLESIWALSSQRLNPTQRKVIEVLSMLNPDGTPEEMLRYANHHEPNLAFLSSDTLDFIREGSPTDSSFFTKDCSSCASPMRLAAPMGFAELLSDAAYYNYESDTLADGRKLTDTAEAICEGFVDSDSSYIVRANVYSLAAVMRWGQGITTRGDILRRFLQAQALLQKHINELSPDEATPEILRLYATGWNDVAHVFIEHEFYEDAIQLLELCAAIKRRLGDEFGVWAVNRNKALALAWSGRSSEALKLLLLPRCASYYERCRFAWANILLMTGGYQRALSLLEKNLERRKNLHGEAGRLTLDSHFLLGVVHCKMGNPQESIKYLTAALNKALNNPRSWSDEARTLAKHHLSLALRDVSRHGEALKHELQVKSTRKHLCQDYGISLPQTAASGDEIYDHLASSEMGRTTVGKFQVSGKLPKLMSLCNEIQARIDDLGGGPVSARVILRACKGGEVDVLEGEVGI
ncbi:hypothetical protein B0H67DRAFT_525944 [Lasiosphaeris hirsuta]|uniref:NB-ARC domain-containing protein n=1 Tax=Lasiosphaeris hirsuta TaxID=260670 RepID=A0AA40BDM1_9PEZI|nr:hypothetical protein B0H67DRAFT_525944 [Lasiosphaeris hirsuta]